MIFFLTISSSAICPRGKQYLNERLGECVNCTKCDSRTRPVVLRPCEFNKDTECGTTEDLNKILELFSQKPLGHVRHKNKKHHRQHGGDVHWTFNEDVLKNNDHLTNTYDGDYASDFKRPTEAPFTKTETLVWDWQGITMTLAVFSCILFFLVIALYSLHQARQWKKLKENFDAGKQI